MSASRWKTFMKFLRYAGIMSSQIFSNPDYCLYWLISTALAGAYFETVNVWAWGAIAVFNLFVGLLAVGSVVRKVDRVMLSLGLGHEKTGYGEPTWIVSGSRPYAADVIPIRAAGFAASDFEKCLPQISSRLSQPIETIRKPSASVPIIEIVIKRSRLPSYLDYRKLPLDELRPGEFFIGQSDKDFIKAVLSKLPHMLVAGQTGAGKTTFVQQLIATILTRTPGAHVCLIDMKSGIDFQPFLEVPSFELVSTHEGAKTCIAAISALYEARKAHLLKKTKQNWDQFSQKDLANEKTLDGLPLGPVLLVIDELAELSKIAKGEKQNDKLQEDLASFARLCRYAGIHLILGTQRPDKRILDMQSKDNCPARVCFSVPSVAASNLVLGDMTATSLGAHPGRAVYQLGHNQVVQTPHIKGAVLEERMSILKEKLKRANYSRRVVKVATQSTSGTGEEVEV
jgi:hypothetical protein